MIRRLPFLLLLILVAAGSAAAQQGHEGHDEREGARPAHVVPDHSFADVERWSSIFDDPERDAWQKPEEIVEALAIGPGSVVADVGAGTGYFMVHLAPAVAPGGKIFAIDIEPNMVDHLRRRADDEGLSGVHAIRADPDDPKVPAGIADRVLLVDTYHHIEGRVDYLRRLKGSLAAKGQVVVIDFFKRKLPVGPPPEHKMARGHVIDEFEEAGYRLLSEETFLPHQYFLRFVPEP